MSHLLTNGPEHATTTCYYSHLPEFTVEAPEDVQAETSEVQKILLLEMRGILQEWREKNTA